jgi:uncharacterized protein YecE (DUF72 family)
VQRCRERLFPRESAESASAARAGSYKHWRGLFYPDELPQKRWFEFYSAEFDTVEINATFYRLQRTSTFEKWRSQAPPGFLYAVKANRFITHMKKLKESKEPLRKFFTPAKHLKETLGPILYQLPANFHKDVPRLEAFLKSLPGGVEHAFEFRDKSWYDDEVFGALDKRGAGVVVHDMTGSESPLVAVGSLAYLRFHGTGGKYHGRYGTAQLRHYGEWLRGQRKAGRSAYAYFNNDIHGHAIEDARTLKSIVGQMNR